MIDTYRQNFFVVDARLILFNLYHNFGIASVRHDVANNFKAIMIITIVKNNFCTFMLRKKMIVITSENNS